MASLYDLTGDYAKFAEYMEQVELEPEMQEALEDALNNLGEDIEIKFENYAKIIKNFESDIAGLKAEEERLAKKRKAMENSIKNMKQRMTEAMIQTGKVDIKGELFKFKVQANPPAVVMDVNYIEDVPEKYLIAQDPKIDRKKLAEDLKAGVELEGVAHLGVNKIVGQLNVEHLAEQVGVELEQNIFQRFEVVAELDGILVLQHLGQQRTVDVGHLRGPHSVCISGKGQRGTVDHHGDILVGQTAEHL